MRIPRKLPLVVGYLAVTLVLTLPYAMGKLLYEPTARETATVAAAGALAVVAILTASGMQHHIGTDLRLVRAWRVAPSAPPPPLIVRGARRDALRLVALAAGLVVLGAMQADLARGAEPANAAGRWANAAWYWALALVVATVAALWPLRLRRVLATPPHLVEVVTWVRLGRSLNRPPVWLVVAPVGATRLSDLVAIRMRGTDPPPHVAGPLWVHGRLRPGRVAVVRSPDGGAYWPCGVCWGPLPLAFHGIDVQPGE